MPSPSPTVRLQQVQRPTVPERRRNPMGTVLVIVVLAVAIACGTVLAFSR
ncbi:hypothetical protein [Thermomonospora echinospora]|nr:hypothetical protein [Thermomonospora echinospora]